MLEITSSHNQYIKLAASLQLKKKRQESGLFLLEGANLIEEALKRKIKLKQIFSRSDHYSERCDQLIIKAEKAQIEVFTINAELMKKITSTEGPVPILAIAEIPKTDEEQINLLKNKFILYCENIQDPGNLGAIIRSAAAAAVDKILLSADCVDIYNPKTLRSSVGTVFTTNILKLKGNLEASIKSNNNALTLIASSSHADMNYKELAEKIKTEQKPILLMMGNEANGLSKESLKLCDYKTKIPLTNNVESLNVLAATSILLFEFKGALDV